MKMNDAIRQIEVARAAAGKPALTREELINIGCAFADVEFCEGAMRQGHPTLEDMNRMTDAETALRETIEALKAA